MKAIAALAILAVTTVAAPAQQRQTSPQQYDRWCRDMQIIEGSVQYCMAYTLEQCLASRTAPNERCYLNPIYDPRYRR
jgi:hypothetical protein